MVFFGAFQQTYPQFLFVNINIHRNFQKTSKQYFLLQRQ